MRGNSAGWRIFSGHHPGAGTVSLGQWLAGREFSLETFLETALSLTELLQRLHRRHLLLWDFNPERIFVDPVSRQVYIGDLTGQVFGAPGNGEVSPEVAPAGSLAYLAPEQIGRLDIKVDQRSDLYGLGVLLYELVTGRLPIQAEDPAGWSHAILTRVPEEPGKLVPGLPAVISAIIMKLLEKAVENRYQSAKGLLWDLQECRRRLQETGTIPAFPVGTLDAAASFRLPAKLYGREEEKEFLEGIMARVTAGEGQVVLLSGEPGVGKTMLVHEVLKPAALQKGYFAAGKFDQLRQNVPYAAFADAFRELVQRLMTESREELESWKKSITKTLGRNGAVVQAIVPELAWLTGPLPPLEELPPKEAENRFLLVFRDFVRVLARRGRPLVLFLDDLQWADPASLKLFSYLAGNGELGAVLLIGAFRENELSEKHPLKDLGEAVRLSLKPWKREHVTQFLAEAFAVSGEEVEELAALLFRKTAGNPFFLTQLLKLAYTEGLIYFDPEAVRWQWQLEAIQQRRPESDVLLLFLYKLQRLPEETLSMLKWAACIGSRFSLAMLAAVSGKSGEETAFLLQPAQDDGLVLETEDQVEFLHDWVQHALYSLLSEAERKEKHLAIGRWLLAQSTGDKLGELVLPMMDHFNRSLTLIEGPEERIKLAEYNLLAGRKAKTAAAYASALSYFRSGTSLLPPDAWTRYYSLSYDLHLERAQVASLQIILYGGIGEYAKAVRTGIEALGRLGIKVPFKPTKKDYAKELALFLWHMRRRKTAELVALPEVTDPRQRVISELLARLCSVTMASYPDLHGLVILKTGNYAARHGHTAMSSVGYLGYSITAGIILGNYPLGEELCRVAIALADKYGNSASSSIIYFVAGGLISHWTRPAREGLAYLEEAVRHGVEAGDVLIMGYAHVLLLEMPYWLGMPLEEFKQLVHRKGRIARQLKHDNLLANVALYEKLVSLLQGREEGQTPPGLQAARWQESGVREIAQKDGAALGTYHILDLYLNYLAGNYAAALEAAERVYSFMGSIQGFLVSAEFFFYHALAIAAYFRELPAPARRRHRRIFHKHLRQVKKWASFCPENFAHKYWLLAAEKARLEGRVEEAMGLYDRAAQSAQENGYRQNQALACELAAKFYLSLGLKKVARTYLEDAFHGYRRWGALAKVGQLLADYRDLLAEVIPPGETGEGGSRPVEEAAGLLVPKAGEAASGVGMLQWAGEAAAAMARETEIEKLFDAFLANAMKILGADKGYLIMEKGDELFVETARENHRELPAGEAVPLEEFALLPKTVIRYVARTLETVAFQRREQWGIFAVDPYLAEFAPKSVVCLPLLFQGIPYGVAYFENSILPGLFGADQLETVKLMASQIAYINQVQSYLMHQGDKLPMKGNDRLVEPLSERELEVLRLIAAGLSNKEIAERLDMTVNTAKTHIRNIYGKLQVNRRVQAVEKARQMRIL